MAVRAVRREADRTGLDRLLHHVVDRLQVARRRLLLVVRAALAHHVGADGAVRDERCEVAGGVEGVGVVEPLGEGLPAPVAHALFEGCLRDVLNALPVNGKQSRSRQQQQQQR